MRDLDEAIKHCHEVAEEQRRRSELYDEWSAEDEGNIEECLECAKEHEQLADWLEELKARREQDQMKMNIKGENDAGARVVK